MSPAGSGVRLSWKWIRHRIRIVLLLCVVGGLLSVAVVGLVEVTGSTRAAVRDAVSSDHGGMEVVLQTGEQAVQKRLSTVESLHPVGDRNGSASAHGAEVPVLIRSVRDSRLHLGVLVDGRRPRRPPEVTLSRSAARALGVGVGDGIQVRSEGGSLRAIQIVGLTANPANAQDRTVVRLDPGLSSSATTMWLSDRDPYTVESLRNDLDRRAVTTRTVPILADDVGQRLPTQLSVLRRLPLLLMALLAILACAVLAAFAPVVRRDVESLVAVGLTPVGAWRRVAGITASALFIGEAIGILAVTVGLEAGRTFISGLIGQDWQRIAVPWALIGGLGAGTVLSVLAAGPVLLRLRSRWSGRFPHRSVGVGPVVRRLVAIGGIALLLVAAHARRQDPPGHLASWALVAAALVACGLPQLVGAIATYRSPPATRAVLRHLMTAYAGVVVVSLVIAVGVAGHTAKSTHNAHVFESASLPLQPPGSFLITEVPSAAADQIVSEYRATGGARVRQYDLPDERAMQLRVTGPGLLRCMADQQTYNPDEVEESCFPQRTQAPVNGVALAYDRSAAATADPGLVMDGQVGLMVYKTLSNEISRIVETDAQPDGLLGGNMPGLVVPPTGDVATAFGLVASGSRLVALLDFGHRAPQDQARMRGLITRLGPAAQTADGTGPGGYARDRDMARVFAVLGSILVFLILVIGGSAVAVGERRLRRTLVDLGSGRSARRRIGGRWCAASVAAGVVAVPLTLLGVLRLAEISAPGGHGWWWPMPFTGFILGCLVAAVMFVRIPARADD